MFVCFFGGFFYNASESDINPFILLTSTKLNKEWEDLVGRSHTPTHTEEYRQAWVSLLMPGEQNKPDDSSHH